MGRRVCVLIFEPLNGIYIAGTKAGVANHQKPISPTKHPALEELD